MSKPIQMLSRDEHLERAKRIALAYLDQPVPDVKEALMSMMSDLMKHPETREHKGIQLCVGLMMIGDLQSPAEARRFIEGYR